MLLLLAAVMKLQASGRFNNQDYLKRYTPSQIEERDGLYREYLGLSNVSFNQQALQEYQKSRIDSISKFTQTKIPPDNKSVEALLEGKDDVKKKFNDALKPTEAYTKAQEKHAADVTEFQKNVRAIPSVYKAEALVRQMTEIGQRGRETLKAQQQHDKEKLQAFVDSPEFKDSLPATYTAEEKNVVAKKLISELDTSHKAELTAYNESNRKASIEMLGAAAKQTRMNEWIATLHSTNPKMRTEFEILCAANGALLLEEANKKIDAQNEEIKKQNKQIEEDNKKAGAVQKELLELLPRKTNVDEVACIDINVGDDKSSLSSLDIDQLTCIKSLTGKEIQISKNAKGEHVFSIEFQSRALDPGYYFGFNENTQDDFFTAVKGLQALGYKSVTLTLDSDDPEINEERAKKFYAASIKAGVPPEKIFIKYGEDEKPINIQKELYGNDKDTFKALLEESKQVIGAREALTSTKEIKTLETAYRKLIQEGKAEEKAKGKDKVAEKEVKPEDKNDGVTMQL